MWAGRRNARSLAALLARAIDSLSGALTLRREAGAAKTTLLDETATAATAVGLLAVANGACD